MRLVVAYAGVSTRWYHPQRNYLSFSQSGWRRTASLRATAMRVRLAPLDSAIR